jgi:hypothetical protein
MICKIIILSLVLIRLGVHLALHGTSKLVRYNFWGELVSAIIYIGLLYGAGFFN